MKNRIFAYAKTKTQIRCAVTVQLISAFVFAIQIVLSLYFLNPKFQVSSHLPWLYSPVCVGPGRKPRRPIFSQRGSNVLCLNFGTYLMCHVKNRIFAYAKTKTQIRCAVTVQLISAFVFAIQIVLSLYFLNPKFQVSSHLPWLYSPVCVGPGRKPRRPIFSQRGSNVLCLNFGTYLMWYTRHSEINCKFHDEMTKTWYKASISKAVDTDGILWVIFATHSVR